MVSARLELTRTEIVEELIDEGCCDDEIAAHLRICPAQVRRVRDHYQLEQMRDCESEIVG
jgi:predicted transcriptional regulator